jgi:hypothetical protein
MVLAINTASTSNPTQLSALDPDGTVLGQSASDLISFYNATPIVQPTTSTDAITALQNLGLLGAGTFTITGQYTVSTNETASSVSSVTATAIPPTGFDRINATVAKTYFIAAPQKGTEKFLYCDIPTTAIIKVQVNSTELGTSLVVLGLYNAQSTLLSTSASSLGMIVITNTTAITGAGVTLVAASSVEWVVKASNSTIVTYTT